MQRSGAPACTSGALAGQDLPSRFRQRPTAQPPADALPSPVVEAMMTSFSTDPADRKADHEAEHPPRVH